MPLLTKSSSFATGGKFLPPVANYTRHLPPAYPGGKFQLLGGAFFATTPPLAVLGDAYEPTMQSAQVGPKIMWEHRLQKP